MEPEVGSEFDKIWAILHAAEHRASGIERRAIEAHQRAMERMDRIEETHQKAMGGMRKLMLEGMK